MMRLVHGARWSLDAQVHANGVFLAGILTDFYRDYHRNYNWGSGFSIKSGFKWSLAKEKVSFEASNSYYRIYTWQGYDSEFDWSLTPEGRPVNIQGDSSVASFNHFEAQLNYRIHKRLFLSAGVDFYNRWSKYDSVKVTLSGATTYTPHIESKQIGFHILVTYKL